MLDRLGHACSWPRGPTRAEEPQPGGRRFPAPAPATSAAAQLLMRGKSSSSRRAGRGDRKGDRAPLRVVAPQGSRSATRDRAAEETARSSARSVRSPILVRGNIAGDRVLREIAELPAGRPPYTTPPPAWIRAALEVEDKHWDWTMSANARALLSLARVTAPSMPSGIVDRGPLQPRLESVLENYVLVGTSKAALESLVRYLAVELAPRGSGSTPSRAASSRPVRSSTSRTAGRCSRRRGRLPPAGWSTWDIAEAVALPGAPTG